MFAFSGDEASNRRAVCKNCGEGGCRERDGGGDDNGGAGLAVHVRVMKPRDFSPMATLYTSESHKTATNKQGPKICYTSLVL